MQKLIPSGSPDYNTSVWNFDAEKHDMAPRRDQIWQWEAHEVLP
jgi:hypothetical protein